METIINKLPEDINYMFYIKPKGAKRFSTYNPCKGTTGTGRVFTELYRKENLLAVCKWIAEDESGYYAYQLRSGDGKKIYWEHNPMYATQATEAPRISTEAAETANVSAEGKKAAERAENKPTFTEVAQMVQTELAKNKAMHTAWHLEFPDGTECDMRYKCTVAGCDFYEYTEARNGEDTFKDYKATENDIALYICQQLDMDVLEPPQSPETPQTAECIADAPKPRETARKPQNRGIGSKRATRRDTLRDTLRPVTYVPRECSTADAAYW